MLNIGETELIADSVKAVVSAIGDLCCASEQLNEVFNSIYERAQMQDSSMTEGEPWEIAEGALQSEIHDLTKWVRGALEIPSCPFIQEAHSHIFG